MTTSVARAGRVSLTLLGGFALRIAGDDVALPMHSRRVLAYLSLDMIAEHDCDRGVLAERLWPDAATERARASLRTALWRIRRAGPEVVLGGIDRIRLSDKVEVDVHVFRSRARQLLADVETPLEAHAQLVARTSELLPGWDETWLLLAREQLRHLRLHALEASARQLAAHGRNGEAIDTILTLIAEEPLRESAQTALIDAHLREGNVYEARRQLHRFATLLWDELGLRPSRALFDKVGLAYPSPVVAATG